MKRQPMKPFQPQPNLALADKVARARKATPRVDATGKWHAECAALAHALGVDTSDVVDEWAERAATLEYDGNHPRDVAEARAFEHTRERFQSFARKRAASCER